MPDIIMSLLTFLTYTFLLFAVGFFIWAFTVISHLPEHPLVDMDHPDRPPIVPQWIKGPGRLRYYAGKYMIDLYFPYLRHSKCAGYVGTAPTLYRIDPRDRSYGARLLGFGAGIQFLEPDHS